jgi:hypothetical protein
MMLKMRVMDPPLRSVMVRGYEPEQYTELKLDAAWNRLRSSQRVSLARGSVYSPELLLTEERHNLLRNRWNPLGPSGVQGMDYRVFRLFVRQGEPGEPLDQEILPAGLYVDGWHRGVVQLPEGRARIRLDFTPVMREREPQQEPIAIRWYGRGLDRREFSNPIWRPQRRSFIREFDGGLLEIICSAAQVVRVYREVDAHWQEITPDSSYLRLYALDAQQPVRYTLANSSSADTSFRIDLRVLMQSSDETAHREVEYRLLNIDGSVSKRGRLAFQSIPSLYDRLAGGDFGEFVSEPVSFYFRLAGDTAAIEFSSQAPIWLNAYTRPMGLVRRMRVPEDYYRDLQDTGYQPAWFIVNPDNERQLVDGLRTAALNIQRRPPVDDPEIVAGRYDWEEFRPHGRWRGRHLLIERSSQLALRDEALQTLYYPIAGNSDERVDLRAGFGRDKATPDLIYLRAGDEREKLSLFLDGRLFHQADLAASQGQIQLPAMEPGEHRLRLQAPGKIHWFINHVESDMNPMLRRFANRLEARGMEFIYHKQSPREEVLTGQFFSTVQSPRAGIEVGLSALGRSSGPLTAWTFDERFYDLRLGAGAGVPVLGTRSQHASEGVRFFLPLGEDLQPGQYRIRIRPAPGVEGYLSLYRLIPGESPGRDIFVERG